jgi:translation elongation factor EF-Tu-like GTPase
MATKKKAKTKAKKKKTATGKVTVRKKPAGKKAAAKKKPAVKAKAVPGKKRVTARAPAPMPKPATPAIPPGTERIGIITHYYSHLSVAILKLETGSLRVGDLIHIRGHTSDFSQPVESMEIDHVHVNEARPGQSFGLRVKEHAREHDGVYKAKS